MDTGRPEIGLAEPGLAEQTDTETRTRLAPPWNVIVHNDAITLMSYVTMVFQKLFGYDYPHAYRLMMEVHTAGRAIVWTGAREEAELHVQRLHSHQLRSTMESTGE